MVGDLEPRRSRRRKRSMLERWFLRWERAVCGVDSQVFARLLAFSLA